MAEDRERVELGAFLRARRGGLDRAEYGLPPVGRGRSAGLRREEVAFLSGVSLTWYTWLEQGRDIHPSRQVLDAIAGALRLTQTEHDYVLALAGFASARAEKPQQAPAMPAHVQRLLDSLTDQPGYALAADWAMVGWNAAYQTLYPRVATIPAADRNLLWLVFTDPSVRALLADWEVTSGRFLAEFRAEAGPRLGDDRVRALIARLSEASAEFRDGWARHDITGFQSRERVFHHPVAGTLVFEHHQLRPSDHPELQLVVYTAVDDSVRDRLRSAIGERA